MHELKVTNDENIFRFRVFGRMMACRPRDIKTSFEDFMEKREEKMVENFIDLANESQQILTFHFYFIFVLFLSLLLNIYSINYTMSKQGASAKTFEYRTYVKKNMSST